MKNICIISVGNVFRQPRIIRQLNYFSTYFTDYKIYILSDFGYNNENLQNYIFFKFEKFNWFKQFFRKIFYIKTKNYDNYIKSKRNLEIIKKLSEIKFDLVIIHGIRNIILGLEIANGAKIILDAHEYYPENFSDNWIWRFMVQDYYKYLTKNYINKVDYIFTISKGIVELYRDNFNIKNVELITNATTYRSVLKPGFVNPDEIKIIHHGDCSSSRKLELMIEAAKFFNRNIHLYLMLVVSRGYGNYYKKLRKLADGLSNVHFIDPVPYTEIVNKVNQFDIGFIFIPPNNLNLCYTLPNKFFEYIQGRLMIITGPSIEMKNYIERYELGKVTNSFDVKELVNLINNLTAEQIQKYKENSHKAAYNISDEKENFNKMDSIIRSLLNEKL